MNYKDRLITLSNNLQYVILEDTEYEGKLYVLANEVVNNQLDSTITVFRVEVDGEDPSFIEEKDLSVLEAVLVKMH